MIERAICVVAVALCLPALSGCEGDGAPATDEIVMGEEQIATVVDISSVAEKRAAETCRHQQASGWMRWGCCEGAAKCATATQTCRASDSLTMVAVTCDTDVVADPSTPPGRER